MSKVITFSRVFPTYHPRAGEPTYFVEKVLNSIQKNNYWFAECGNCGFMAATSVMEGGGQIADSGDYSDIYCPKCISIDLIEIGVVVGDYYLGKHAPKHHTIRAGHRWKVGDKFSPRVWSGKTYNSKQITIAPDIEVKKVWDFDIDENGICSLNKKYILEYEDGSMNDMEKLIAENDGLTDIDFFHWLIFPVYKSAKPFEGQIICWNENINY